MIGGGGEAPPPNGGEFLLRLLKNSHQFPPQTTQQQSQLLTQDPAVAEIGPSIPIPPYVPNSSNRNGIRPPWTPHQYRHTPPSPSPQPPPPSAPHNYFVRNRNSNPDPIPNQKEQKGLVFGSFSNIEGSNTGFLAENVSVSRQGHVMNRGFNGVEVGFQSNSVDSRVQRTSVGGDHRHWDRNGHNLVDARVQAQERRNYSMGVPTAFSGGNVRQDARFTNRRGVEQNGERRSTDIGNFRNQSGTSSRENKPHFQQHKNNARWGGERKLDNKVGYYPGSSPVSTSSSVSATLESDNAKGPVRTGTREMSMRRDYDTSEIDLDNLKEQLEDTLELGDEVEEKIGRGKHHKTRDKEYRSDKRGQSIMGQKMRYTERQHPCRVDIEAWNIQFLAIYESLIPTNEEKLKQKQLLGHLEKIVDKEWPGSRLYLYGSCANSFGFPKSDLDICLTIDGADISKSKVLLKLAGSLQAENFENVQALTRARVPIVKLMDPASGISCDICVNNVLAVVNTKLLRDYGEIDVRVRQLAFMVKHWAKSRGVNETYQGTLSSYAYVLMCIHFLQLRRPPILPCLQEISPTYSVIVDNVECAFFDRVEKLVGYGSNNRESISRLLWSFFHYWAYCHDYTNDVISVRTGRLLSKRTKDWTRRVGNDRHLICIEDPFELSHDLGRVVDKKSIKVLREEFERAAHIMQYDPNPCVKLFEPYVPS